MARFKQETKVSAQELQEKIRKVAFGLYLKRGGQPGQAWQDWFEAERLVRSGRD